MLFRNAIDIFIHNVRKNLLSVLLIAAGIFLTVFLGLMYCSVNHKYNDINEALGGRIEQYGSISIESDFSSDTLEKILKLDGVMVESRVESIDYPEDYPKALLEQWKGFHADDGDEFDEDYYSVLFADPDFLQYTGVILGDGLSWANIHGVISDREKLDEDTTVPKVRRYIMTGADYSDVPVGTEYVVEHKSMYSGTIQYVYYVLGSFEKGQKTVDESIFGHIERLNYSFSLDSEIVVFEYSFDRTGQQMVFLEDENGKVLDEISDIASGEHIPYSKISVEKFTDYFSDRYQDEVMISAYTRKSLFVLVPIFVLFVIILEIEIFYGEKRHLSLLAVNGFLTGAIVKILAVKYLIILLMAIIIGCLPLLGVLPYYFSMNILEIMQIAMMEKVIPFLIAFLLLVYGIQMTVSVVALKNTDVVEAIRFTE